MSSLSPRELTWISAGLLGSFGKAAEVGQNTPINSSLLWINFLIDPIDFRSETLMIFTCTEEPFVWQNYHHRENTEWLKGILQRTRPKFLPKYPTYPCLLAVGSHSPLVPFKALFRSGCKLQHPLCSSLRRSNLNPKSSLVMKTLDCGCVGWHKLPSYPGTPVRWISSRFPDVFFNPFNPFSDQPLSCKTERNFPLRCYKILLVLLEKLHTCRWLPWMHEPAFLNLLSPSHLSPQWVKDNDPGHGCGLNQPHQPRTAKNSSALAENSWKLRNLEFGCEFSHPKNMQTLDFPPSC